MELWARAGQRRRRGRYISPLCQRLTLRLERRNALDDHRLARVCRGKGALERLSPLDAPGRVKRWPSPPRLVQRGTPAGIGRAQARRPGPAGAHKRRRGDRASSAARSRTPARWWRSAYPARLRFGARCRPARATSVDLVALKPTKSDSRASEVAIAKRSGYAPVSVDQRKASSTHQQFPGALLARRWPT